MNHIELFAGCGGLCLGLEAAGFSLLFANELSPMAAETFAYNFFKENLQRDDPRRSKVFWLGSNYPRSQMHERLREDPRLFPPLGEGYTDIPEFFVPEGLLVGSIKQLNEWLRKNPSVCSLLRSANEGQGVDLISGGPPCQSFSLAGMREKDNAKNLLPLDFVEFSSLVQPKIVLLENVTGILRPFTEKKGKYYAWFEIAKAFCQNGYVPLPLHINAKFVGVPQNRPRFIMFCLRKDFFDTVFEKINEIEKDVFEFSFKFFKNINNRISVDLLDLPVLDFEKGTVDIDKVKNTFLRYLFCVDNYFTSITDAIDDLETGNTPSLFVERLNEIFMKDCESMELKNHELRANSLKVKRRFSIYQVASKVDLATKKDIFSMISGKTKAISERTWKNICDFSFLKENDRYEKFAQKNELEKYLASHITKKQTQRALIAGEPAPAALSIPDDFCHYRDNVLRTLTVREMARIQSFPDKFTFLSKITTGGRMRSFEVPQYTQVGNAVPPLLGYSLGLVVKELLGYGK